MRNNKKMQVIPLLFAMSVLLLSCVQPVEGNKYLFEGPLKQINPRTEEVTSCEYTGPITLKKLVRTFDGNKIWSIEMRSFESTEECQKEGGQFYVDKFSFALGAKKLIEIESPRVRNRK